MKICVGAGTEIFNQDWKWKISQFRLKCCCVNNILQTIPNLTKPSDNEEYAQNQKIAAIPLVLRNCGGGGGDKICEQHLRPIASTPHPALILAEFCPKQVKLKTEDIQGNSSPVRYTYTYI